ncbi:MAG TPA: ABC transporter substrate-binding protein [Acidimicrobiia bacterium]|nr:ABC transporter substrate-binding protein [Acidimicrobiia bacterium]
MKFRRSRLVVLLMVVALVAGACRDDGDDEVDAGGGGGGDEVSTDIGVTSEPCPDAVNKDHGCIYLGTISDLTKGPFAALAVPITAAQKGFWAKVNQDGGIGDYDVDVTSYVRDNEYVPTVHKAKYDEIKGKVLGLIQTLGTPTTEAIIGDLESEKVVSVPASWTSLWAFKDVILESGTSYCMEAMNSVDWAVTDKQVKSVMAVHYPGDYGGDAAAGAKLAAERNKITFTDVPTTPGQQNQAEAISKIIQAKPDLVILTTGPVEAGAIVGEVAVKGYKGVVVGTSPTWNPGLLKSAAAPALQALYFQSAPWAPWGADTPGHKALRDTLGAGFTPNDGATAGWVWSYAMKAALEKAVADGDITRAGLLEAASGLSSVDYEGMLPEGAGNYSGEADASVVRQSLINQPDPAAPTGVKLIKDFFVGDTAKAHKLDKACYL